jgi:hypothetical protein
MQTNLLISKRNIPGITAKGIEFFTHDGRIKMIHKGSVKDFIDIPSLVIDILKIEIGRNPIVKKELEKLYPDSKINQIYKFINCRFGGLDCTPDILDGKLQESEYWDCPLHGNCSSEGILCKKIIHKGNELSWLDISLMQLLTTEKTNEVIAEELNIPLGSFHSMKKRLYDIFKVSTKQELTKICMFLNFI